MTENTLPSVIMSDRAWINPLHGITDAASADKFVEDALAEATPEEMESLARIYLGDKYDEWKRLKDAARVASAADEGAANE